MSIVDEMVKETILEHSGVKGMHWGQRLYQNPDGSYTELGKARRRVGYKETPADDNVNIGGKAYKDMTRSELKAAKKRARHNEKMRREAREFNRDKADAMKKADLDFITKHLDKFSNEEIETVVDRYKRMQVIKDLNKAEKSSKTDAIIDKAIKYLDKAATASDKISRIYNNIQDSGSKKREKEKKQRELDKMDLELDKLRKNEKSKTEIYNEKIKEIEYNKKKREEAAELEDWKEKRERQKKKDEYEYLDYIETLAHKRKKEKLDRLKVQEEIKNKKNNKGGKGITDDDLEKIVEYLKDNDVIISGSSNLAGKGNSWFNKIINNKKSDHTYSDKDIKDIYKNLDNYTEDLYKRNSTSSDNYWSSQKFGGDYERDKRWNKQLEKKGYAYYDKMIKEIASKYRKERNMNKDAAVKKAEQYVDDFLLNNGYY